MEGFVAIPGKRIEDVEHEGRYYIELPDGYRLIFDENGYAGRYDPNLPTVI